MTIRSCTEGKENMENDHGACATRDEARQIAQECLDSPKRFVMLTTREALLLCKAVVSAPSETVPSGWREALRHIRVNLDAGGTSASSHDFLHTHGSALLDKVAEALEALPSATRPRLPQHVKDFIDDRSDIRDGQDGPLPNDWMTLQQMIEEAGL